MSDRRSALAVVAALAVVLAVTCPEASAGTFQDTYDQSFPLAEGGAISLENINGDVRIETWDRAEVRVVAERQASSQELLDKLEIEVDSRPDSLEVEVHYPGTIFGGGSSQVDFTLSVPRTAELDSVELVNGDLEVVGVRGGVEAATVNGDIAALEVSGEVELATVNGTIEVTCDRSAAGDHFELESVNGAIELLLGPGAGATIRAETVNGRISNDLGLEVHQHKYVGADLSGRVGDGATRVELSTVNGAISIQGR